MPVIEDIQLSSTTRIMVWEIKETIDFLKSKLDLTDFSKKKQIYRWLPQLQHCHALMQLRDTAKSPGKRSLLLHINPRHAEMQKAAEANYPCSGL